MSNSFLNYKNHIIILPIILTIFISCFFIPILSDNKNITISTDINTIKDDTYIDYSSNSYTWPISNYTKISSHFGLRNAPAKGAATFHAAIDIPAPPGTNVIAIQNGKVTFTGWYGANGYSIIIEHSNGITCTYGHMDPNFNVSIGMIVNKGTIVGKIGPLNIYGINDNPYKDKNGNPTNGATTGPHLHFSLKKDNKAINPLELY